eukprot:PhM_4_TR3606/c0_g1_i1/m.49893
MDGTDVRRDGLSSYDGAVPVNPCKMCRDTPKRVDHIIIAFFDQKNFFQRKNSSLVGANGHNNNALQGGFESRGHTNLCSVEFRAYKGFSEANHTHCVFMTFLFKFLWKQWLDDLYNTAGMNAAQSHGARGQANGPRCDV